MEQADAPAGQGDDMLLWKLLQLFEAFLPQLFPVKAVHGEPPVPNAIVPVAAQDEIAVFKSPVKGEIAGGPLAHDIAQTVDQVGLLARKVAGEGFGRRAVAVQVGNEGDLHGRSS